MSNNKYDLWLHDPASDVYVAQRYAEHLTCLPGGLYSIFRDHFGNPTATKLELRKDALHCVKSEPFKILDEINAFWDKRESYKALGVAHRRGILLEGPPGCGKSVIVQMAIADIVERSGIAFSIQNIRVGTDPQFIVQIRQIQPDVAILFVLEDIDSVMEDHGAEETLLEMMDGVSASGEGIMFLATTNNLEKVPKRIRCRPSRIDKVVHVGYPDQPAREEYVKFLTKEHPLTREHLIDLSMNTVNMGFAEIKDVVVGLIVYGRKITEVLDDARARKLEREKL